MTGRLDPADVEAIARRVVELLDESRAAAAPAPQLLTAQRVAERVGMSAEWVRDHAAEFGAVRLGEQGEGKRPRLRFPPEAVGAALAALVARSGPPPADPAPARRRRRRAPADVELLPVKDR